MASLCRTRPTAAICKTEANVFLAGSSQIQIYHGQVGRDTKIKKLYQKFNFIIKNKKGTAKDELSL